MASSYKSFLEAITSAVSSSDTLPGGMSYPSFAEQMAQLQNQAHSHNTTSAGTSTIANMGKGGVVGGGFSHSPHDHAHDLRRASLEAQLEDAQNILKAFKEALKMNRQRMQEMANFIHEQNTEAGNALLDKLEVTPYE